MQEAEAREVMEGIVTAFTYFGRRAATGFVIPEWLPTPENQEYQGAVERLDRTVYRIIADRRAALREAAAQGGAEPKVRSGCAIGSRLARPWLRPLLSVQLES